MKKAEDTEKLITDFLKANPGHSYKSRELAKKLGVPNLQYRNFKMTLRTLAEADLIARAKGGRYGAPIKANTVEGVLHVKTQPQPTDEQVEVTAEFN